MTDWHHAPRHRLLERGAFIVTAGIYQKPHSTRRTDFLKRRGCDQNSQNPTSQIINNVICASPVGKMAKPQGSTKVEPYDVCLRWRSSEFGISDFGFRN